MADPKQLQTEISDLLSADPICIGRVSEGTIEALAALAGRTAQPDRDELRRAKAMLDMLLLERWADHQSDAVRRLKVIQSLLSGLASKTATLPSAVPPECPNSPIGRHQVDTSMEEGPHHCFNCGIDMRAEAQ